MLYLVATPIGNLEDISFRAIKVLGSVDWILCEDTRRAQILLSHYQIKKPLRSLHKFNEAKKLNEIIDSLKSGQNIALISDAGTPTLFDPGVRIVKACRKENLPFTSIPGACSPILALTLSGFDLDRVQCIGFLPRKPKALSELLSEIFAYPGTTATLESPFRLVKTLEAIHALDPNRPLFIARELTKKFEEQISGTAQELIAHFKKKSVKGEFVLVIPGL